MWILYLQNIKMIYIERADRPVITLATAQCDHALGWLTRSFTSRNIFILPPLLLITRPACASQGFLHHPRCMGPLSASHTWKGPRWSGNPAWKQKDSFSYAHTLEQSERQLFPSRVHKRSDLILPPSTISSAPLIADLWKYQKQMEGPTKVVQKRDMCNQATPLCLLWPEAPHPPALLNSDNWDSGAVLLSASALLSQCQQLIRADGWHDESLLSLLRIHFFFNLHLNTVHRDAGLLRKMKYYNRGKF